MIRYLMQRKAFIEQVQAGYERGKADLAAGRYREINTPEDARALKADILAKARALRTERNRYP